MTLFSERHGYVAVNDALQVEEMDRALRTSLWNVFHGSLMNDHNYPRDAYADSVLAHLWVHHYKMPIDEVPQSMEWCGVLHQRFLKEEWFKVYDLLEATIQALRLRSPSRVELYATVTNLTLERERSGYRLVQGLITPIVASAEIEAIDEALAATAGLPGAQHHLQAALGLLADRANPDFANSIKESISAVESVCASIVGNKSATAGQAVKHLRDKGVDIHPALEKGWSNLYGYTSDDDGIRHGGQKAPTVELEDATYFLISCSAFVNLLVAKCARAGITLSPVPE